MRHFFRLPACVALVLLCEMAWGHHIFFNGRGAFGTSHKDVACSMPFKDSDIKKWVKASAAEGIAWGAENCNIVIVPNSETAVQVFTCINAGSNEWCTIGRATLTRFSEADVSKVAALDRPCNQMCWSAANLAYYCSISGLDGADCK